MNATSAAPAPKSSIATRAVRTIKGTAPVFVLLFILIALIAQRTPVFLEPPVFLAFLLQAAPLVLLACGQLFVIVSGEFDLSVGSLMTVTVVTAARLIDGDPAKTYPVMALLFGIGLLVGLINGFVTTRLRVPSFITTLGMLLILDGAVNYWTGGAPRGSLPDNFRVFGRGAIEDVPVLGRLPYAVIVLLVLGALGVYLLHFTDVGRRMTSTGGNPVASALSGINVPRVKTTAFVLSALFAVAAGILYGGFTNVSARVGEGFELQAISAVVLGGALLGGGRGSMGGAMAGALSLVALFRLLNLYGYPQEIRDVLQGLIIIAAVAWAAFRSRAAS
jgi:ribose transport system permease protein